VRIALGLEYHGGGYCGWQTQPNGCGIQDVVQRALSTIAEQAVEVLSAGRTDTGVHAIEQVIHFETSAVRPLTAWVRGANANLPNDIAVLWAHPVPNEFHARYSARSRSYRYVLLNRPQRAAAAHARVGWFHQPLDREVMSEAAKDLVGRHDFSAFRSSECQAKTPIKTVSEFRVYRHNDLVIFELRADGFLHHMVRNMVGSLVYVGSGRVGKTWLRDVLQSKDRRLAAPTFAADGLYLTAIAYDAGWGLPQIASRSDTLSLPALIC